MSYHTRLSPKEFNFSQGEKIVRRARTSSDGSSPRRRWSPRLSPSLRRRPKKYAHLKLSPTDPSDENPFKENESPVEELSMDGIPIPKASSRTLPGTPSSGAQFSLPSPSSNARRQRTPIRGSSHSRLSSETYDSRHVNDESKRENIPGSTQSRYSSLSDISRNNNEESKREQRTSKRSDTSPIFRLNVQTVSAGIETTIEKDPSNPTFAFAFDGHDKDDFTELINARRESIGISPEQKSSSRLHDLCSGISTLDDVMRAQSFLTNRLSETGRIVDIVSSTDQKGRTPLHIFSENKVLATAIGIPSEIDFETREYVKLYQQPTFDPDSNLEKHVLNFLISDLLAAYPGAMMCRDRDGHIPFESALFEWVQSNYGSGEDVENEEHGYLSNLASYTNSVSRAWGNTSTTLLSAVKLGASKFGGEMGAGVTVRSPKTPSNGANNDETFEWNNVTADLSEEAKEFVLRSADRRKHRNVLSNVRLTPHARFSLMMLSAVVDQLDHYMAPELFKSKSSRARKNLGCGSQEEFERVLSRVRTFRDIYGSVDISSAVVQNIASIPDLMRTVLLLQDEGDRDFVLSTSIIRRVMVCKNSIGPWFTIMLQSRDRRVAQRSVDYLKAVSHELSVGKYSASGGSRDGQMNSKQFIDEVSRLQDFIPSLLALGDRGIEEASTTLIVKKVLDRIISRPFAVTVVLCDAIFLTLMILGFRSAVNQLIIGGSLAVVLKWIYVCNTGIFYFIIREIGKTISLFLISKRARMYFFSFWNVIDIFAVALALASTIAMRYHFTFKDLALEEESTLRGLLAVTTGFLWLRVLSLLKAINMQLATFVLAIIQITKDITWFCVILLTLVVSFAQMFFTLLAPSSCASADKTAMECKQTEYLLRVYTILLGDFGDFEREHFTSGFSVFLVVLYSFLVTVILLNVLIAVASDSYEKCLVRSQNLFGRARVMLIAELVSFQNLLMKADSKGANESVFKSRIYSTWWSSGPWSKNWSRGSVLFFCVSISVIVGWTLAELLGYARGKRHGNIIFSLASVVVNVVLFTAIMIFLTKGAASTKKETPEDEDDTASDSLIQKAMLRLLGASRDPQADNRGTGRGYADDWNGRVDYLQREMTRIATEQSSLSVELSKATENFVNLAESRLRADIGVLEENFAGLKNCLLDEVKTTKSTNAKVTIAVEELKTLISMAASNSPYQSPVPSEVGFSDTIFVRHDT